MTAPKLRITAKWLSVDSDLSVDIHSIKPNRDEEEGGAVYYCGGEEIDTTFFILSNDLKPSSLYKINDDMTLTLEEKGK